jgi:hypothetical protein
VKKLLGGLALLLLGIPSNQISNVYDARLGIAAVIIAGVIGYGLMLTSDPVKRHVWDRWGRRHAMVVIVLTGLITGLLASGVAWLLIKQSAHLPVTPVAWEFDSFLGMGGYPVGPRGNIEPRFSDFQAHGTNTSDKPITKITGHIRSNLTNETFPLYLNVNGVRTPPEETHGIPPRTRFGVVVPLAPDSWTSVDKMLDEETLLRKFGDFTFVVELDGRREEHHFSNERIQGLIAEWKRRVYGAEQRGVTKKESSIVTTPQSTTEQPLKIGTLAFERFVAEVARQKSTGRTSVQMRIEFENTGDTLLRFEMHSIRGEVGGKTVPDPHHPRLDSTGGFVYPHKKGMFIYERIEDVDMTPTPVNGTLEYEMTYSTVPPSITRRSARKIQFQVWNKEVGAHAMVVRQSNEVEE